MRRYKVAGGPVSFGIGEILGLSKEQFQSRRKRVMADDGTPGDVQDVEALQKMFGPKGEQRVKCKVVGRVEFKAGEEIDLPTAPDRAKAVNLYPVDHDDKIDRPAAPGAPAVAKGKGKAAGQAETAAAKG